MECITIVQFHFRHYNSLKNELTGVSYIGASPEEGQEDDQEAGAPTI